MFLVGKDVAKMVRIISSKGFLVTINISLGGGIITVTMVNDRDCWKGCGR